MIPIIFLINLAASDLLVGLTVIIIKVLSFLHLRKMIAWTMPIAWTSHLLKFAFMRMSLLTSVFNLISLTMDRFLAIRNPIAYRMQVRRKQALVIVFMTWFLSVALSAAHYYIINFSGVSLKYDLVIFPAAVFPATITFAICYAKIIRIVFAQGKRLRRFSNSDCQESRHDSSSNGSNRHSNSNHGNNFSSSNNSNSAQVINHHGNYIGNSKNNNQHHRGNNSSKADNCPPHLLKRELKICRLAGTVVLAFVVCWIPIAVVGVTLLSGVKVKKLAVNLVFIFAFMNSTIDPVLYFSFKGDFLKNVRRATSACWAFCRSSRGSPTHQNMRRHSNLFSLTSEASTNNSEGGMRSGSSHLSVETIL